MVKLSNILNEIKVNQPASSLLSNLRKALKNLEHYINDDYVVFIDFDIRSEMLYEVFEETYKHSYDENNDIDDQNWETLQDLFYTEAEEFFSKKYGHPVVIEIEY